jgi:hypothetical protein
MRTTITADVGTLVNDLVDSGAMKNGTSTVEADGSMRYTRCRATFRYSNLVFQSMDVLQCMRYFTAICVWSKSMLAS